MICQISIGLPEGNPPPKNMLNNSSGDISPENNLKLDIQHHTMTAVSRWHVITIRPLSAYAFKFVLKRICSVFFQFKISGLMAYL